MDNPFEKISHQLEQIEDKIQKISTTEPEVLLTKTGATEFLGVSMNTLSKYTKDGTIPAYGIGSRVLFKKSDLIESLIRIN